jgi:hypothetical protein
MKGIFKILSMVILLAALIGAGVLVKKNQETRRGATAAETSAQVLPDKVSAKAGQTFTVDVWLNTGKSTDKLTGAEFRLAFDPAKVVYVSSLAQNGYTILAEDSEGGADRWFKMVAMGDEKAGAVDVVKLTFKAVADGASTIIVGKGATVMVSGQSSTWDVAKSSGSQIETGVVTTTVAPTVSCSWCGTSCVVTKPNMMCTMIAPPKDQKCVVDGTGKGCMVVTDQKTCNSNADCGRNAYCYQPPMPVCKPGMACIDMMPARYCKACTPRLACMDANPACMPDLAAGAPPFCPPVKKTAQEGEMCGGFAGIMCATGLRCEYGLMPEKLPGSADSSARIYPDQSGICVKDTTYCDANGKCPSGYQCVKPGPCPLDAATGRPTACAFRAYCKKLPVTPTPAITCNWCGDSCIDSRLKIACKMTAPPAGKSCKNVNGRCTIVPNLTPTPAAACGARCTQDQQCQGGMTCAPIWWPCGPMPLAAMNKVQSDQGLSQTDVAEMIRICPTVKGVMPSGYESMGSVRMPTFYGVCRNPKCVSSTNCSCAPTPTPTMGVVSCPSLYKQSMIGQNYFSQCLTSGFSKVCFDKYTGVYQGCGQADPNTCTVNNTNAARNIQCDSNFGSVTQVPSNMGTYQMQFSSEKVAVGEEVWLNVAAEAMNNTNKISATKVKIKYFAENFDVLDIQPEGRGTELLKEVDKTAGTITLYYTWNLPADRLFNRYTVANIKMKPKKAGTFMVTFDRTYSNEMSGIDSNGKSISYQLNMNDPKDLVVSAIACGCTNGKAKATGDANCDGNVNSIDFEIWRNEMFDQGGLFGTTKSTWQSDYNCDQKVSGVDFEIWRKTVFK